MIDSSMVTIIIPVLGESDPELYALNECQKSLDFTSESHVIIAKNKGLINLDRIQLLDNQELIVLDRQGQNAAVNAAAAIIDTPWIFVTNDDMIYPSGWWEKLANLSFGNDKGGYDPLKCISPQLVEPYQGAPTFETYFCGGAGGDFDLEKWLEYAETAKGIGVRPGFNLPFLIQRELWNTIGGYDINFDPWGSNGDSDLEYKIKLAGVQPYQNTNCKVYHFSQTSGTFEPRNQSYWQKNWEYFKKKWGFYRTDKGIWEATFDIPTKEEGRTYLPEWEGKYA